jgi:hypothetical protein
MEIEIERDREREAQRVSKVSVVASRSVSVVSCALCDCPEREEKLFKSESLSLKRESHFDTLTIY